MDHKVVRSIGKEQKPKSSLISNPVAEFKGLFCVLLGQGVVFFVQSYVMAQENYVVLFEDKIDQTRAFGYHDLFKGEERNVV